MRHAFAAKGDEFVSSAFASGFEWKSLAVKNGLAGYAGMLSTLKFSLTFVSPT
jgi:hypothetical protein